MFAAMLHSDTRPDTSSLRLCISGGAAMPVEVMRGFEETFDCLVLEGYGLSETSPVASFNHPGAERKPGSIGTPVAGVEMKLVDVRDDGVGEIAIRGHNVMKGYWNRPDATAAAIDADGWFHTGDLARVDDDGYYFIVDRSKDMIIRGATTSIRARSRKSSTSIPTCVRRRSSVSPTRCSAKKSALRSL